MFCTVEAVVRLDHQRLSVRLVLNHACVVRDANMGQQLAGGNSSWCPELESRTAHPAAPVSSARMHLAVGETVILLTRPSP